MAGHSNYMKLQVLKLVFQKLFDGVVFNGGGTVSNLTVALHTADPGDAGTQATNEVTVGQDATYARQTVARSSGGWTVAQVGDVVTASLVADLAFPNTSAVGSGCTITHMSVGDGTNIWYSGTVVPNIILAATTAGQSVRLASGTTVATEN